MTKKKVFSKILLFVLIGLVPGLFLYVFSIGKQEFSRLDYLAGKEAVYVNGKPTGDSTYFKVKNFNMLTKDGVKTLDDFKDKFIVGIVIGTSCPEDCEIHMDGLVNILNDEIGNNSSYDDVVVLCELVNYDSNTKPSLDQIDPYFLKTLDLKKFIFFTCDTNNLYNYSIIKGLPNLYTATLPGRRNGKAYYSAAVLIDKEGHVRGEDEFLYDIKSSSSFTRELRDGIKVLKKEEDYENL